MCMDVFCLTAEILSSVPKLGEDQLEKYRQHASYPKTEYDLLVK